MYLSSTKYVIQKVKNINKKIENINENKNIQKYSYKQYM